MARLRREDIEAMAWMVEQGATIRSAARVGGCDESTLRYHLRRRAEGAGDGRRRQPEAVGPYAEVAEAWIERQREATAAGRRPEAVRRLYEELVDVGYEGSYKAVLRYVRRRMEAPRLRPFRRVEVAPGSLVQVDWALRRVWIDELGGEVELAGFMAVLGASRRRALVWSRDRGLSSWIRCHNEAFTRLGGVPAAVRPDNERTAMSEGAGSRGTVHPVYASYAGELGFAVLPSRPYRPTDKGKVERPIRDLDGLLRGRRFVSLAPVQELTDEALERLDRRRVCPQSGRSVWETWQEERPMLRPLPRTLPEPFDVVVKRRVSRDCLVRFEGREYSVPYWLTGKHVEVRGAGREVVMLWQGREVKRHPRHTVARLVIDQADYEGESLDPAVMRPTPLGKDLKEMALEHSWESPLAVPVRSMTEYEAAVTRLGGGR
jgi:transposase